LKLVSVMQCFAHKRVAPFTGAWIETRGRRKRQAGQTVAPFTGAWIETVVNKSNRVIHKLSPPSRGRGLKRKL